MMEQPYRAVLEVEAGVPVTEVAERFAANAKPRWPENDNGGKEPPNSPYRVDQSGHFEEGCLPLGRRR
jgi:hypothetical protein